MRKTFQTAILLGIIANVLALVAFIAVPMWTTFLSLCVSVGVNIYVAVKKKEHGY